ncbi:MAG: hypothetical protein ABSE62_00675 [Chthoniobacteraceae bacterium]
MVTETPKSPLLNTGSPPLPSTRLVEIPEDALQDLLNGSGQTVEGFLQAQRAKIRTGRGFEKRANVAKWSRLWLAASTLFCLISLISGRDIEDAISVLLLGAMTCVEFKVHDWFSKGDSRGAVYGYWNQTLFAGLFLIYGAYHFFSASAPQTITDMLDASDAHIVLQLSKVFYGTVGLVGATAQYGLALYYKGSLRKN